jgi:hypothetical protein
MLRAFVDRPRDQREFPVRRRETAGSANVYSWDFAPFELAEGVTVSTVTWESSNTGAIAVSDDDLTASVASATLTAVNEGVSLVTLTATTSGAQIAKRQFVVRVIDPTVTDPSSAW